jgi:chitin disaccharide deacetylase
MNRRTSGLLVRSSDLFAPSGMESSVGASLASQSARRNGDIPPAGLLIVNADDWGRDPLTTNRILECSLRRAVSSVSAMVFMKDSDRAAVLAREHEIEAGLHLNFTTPFSAPGCPSRLLERQQQLARYLLRHRLSQCVFHPGLMRSFEYLVAAQIDEFRRIYGADPERLDGHHHMHLCMNVLLQQLLPQATIVRRNFSFERGEKNLWNRLYRKAVDHRLSRRHRLFDYFFSLAPLEPPHRLRRIYSLASQSVIELETHPVQLEEYRYLAGGTIFHEIGDVRIVPPSAIAWREHSAEKNRL